MSDIKRIAKHSINYTLATILNRAIGFFMIPIYTRFLSPADYGIILTLIATTGLLSSIYQMGQIGAWQRFYYDYKDSKEELKKYLGTIIVFVFVFGLGCTILLLTVGERLFTTIAKDVPFKPYVQITLLTVFLSLFFPFWLRLFQIREKSLIYSILNFAYFLVSTLLIIFFVVILRYGALGQVKGSFLATLIFFIISILALGREIKLHVSFTKLKESLKYGLPLVPHSLAGWTMNLADRLFLGHYRNLSEVGLYGIGYTLGSIMDMITNSINLAYIPFFMSTAKDKGDEAKAIFSGLATYYMMSVLFIAACLSIFAKEIIIVMTAKSFHDAYKIVPIVTFSYVLNGMYFLVVNPIFYVKTAVRYLPISTFSSAIINLIFNYLLIPRFGQMGAAYATLITFIMQFILTWFISYKFYPMSFEYKKILLIFLAIAPTLVGGLMLNLIDLSFLPCVFAKLGFVLIYPVLLVLFGVLKWNYLKMVIIRLIWNRKMMLK